MSRHWQDIEKTLARVMFQHALNPLGASYVERQFGGKGKTFTRDEVAARFGEEAAQAWQDAQNAKNRYFAAIRKGGE